MATRKQKKPYKQRAKRELNWDMLTQKQKDILLLPTPVLARKLRLTSKAASAKKSYLNRIVKKHNIQIPSDFSQADVLTSGADTVKRVKRVSLNPTEHFSNGLESNFTLDFNGNLFNFKYTPSSLAVNGNMYEVGAPLNETETGFVLQVDDRVFNLSTAPTKVTIEGNNTSIE